MMNSTLRRLALCMAATLFALAGGTAHADGLPQDPLARFEAPVCPGVIGLRQAAAEQMVSRIRTNAEELGLRLADPESCDPNLVVSFLVDGRDYLRRLAEERPYVFANLTASERNDLLEGAGPVRAWLSTQIRTRDGMRVGERENLVDVPRAAMWSAHSRIYRPVRRDILSATVLIDRDAVGDLTVDQLADYATMRGLAQVFPDNAGSERRSILELFEEGGAPPAELTEFDRAYLVGLYRGIPNLPASARLNGLPPADQSGAE